uniref:Uncharacterized protein n=1 Tax=Rhizophora mucronata TaxID=61149 RepID=A0A2P2JZ84_RHIMU
MRNQITRPRRSPKPQKHNRRRQSSLWSQLISVVIHIYI